MVKEYLSETGYDVMGSPVYRISIGELISARDRRSMPEGVNLNSLTGSIGFSDVIRQLKPIPNPDMSNIKMEETLTVLAAGIEPEFRGRSNYARILLNNIETLARNWGLKVILVDSIQNPKLPRALERNGYKFYPNPLYFAVKRFENG